LIGNYLIFLKREPGDRKSYEGDFVQERKEEAHFIECKLLYLIVFSNLRSE
jgi:hypothetical protein